MKKPQEKAQDWMFFASAIFVLLLAVAGFYLSYWEISQRAADAQIKSGFVFAVMVDGAMGVFSLFVMYSTRNGKRKDATAGRILIGLFVLLSVWFNVGEVQFTVDSAQRIVIHALPPIMILLGFELGFVRVLEQKIERSGAIHTIEFLSSEAVRIENENDLRVEQLNESFDKLEHERNTRIERLDKDIEQLLEQKRELELEVSELRIEHERYELSEVQRKVYDYIIANSGRIRSQQEIVNSVGHSKSGVSNAIGRLTELNLVYENGNGLEALEVL